MVAISGTEPDRPSPAAGSALLRRVAIAFLAVIAVGAAAAPSSAGAFAPRVPSSYFGVSAPELTVMASANDTTGLDLNARAISAAGIGWVRAPVPWRGMETAAPVAGVHSYYWSATDRLVTSLAGQSLSLAADVTTAPYWAEGQDASDAGCRSRSGVGASYADDYGAFVGALVKRYGRGGSFWSTHPALAYEPVTQVELWNEPNWTGYWCPEPDPVAYAAIAAAGARAVRGVDPQATVTLGGLATVQRNQHFSDGSVQGLEPGGFLARAIAAQPGLPSLIDAVGAHLYEPTPAGDLDRLGWFRSRLAAVGLANAKVVVNEFGWRTGGGEGAVSEDARADDYRELVSRLPRTNCGVIGVAAHDWATSDSDPSNADEWYGIANPQTGQLDPTGQAYKDEIALFRGSGAASAPRSLVSACSGGASDTDGDGTADPDDDYPLDPTRPNAPGTLPGDAAIDTTAPVVAVEHIRGRAKHRAPTLRFTVSDSSSIASVRCKVDRLRWRSCTSPWTLPRLRLGRHLARVEATDQAGNRGRSAKLRFRVVGRRSNAVRGSRPTAKRTTSMREAPRPRMRSESIRARGVSTD